MFLNSLFLYNDLKTVHIRSVIILNNCLFFEIKDADVLF